MNASIEETIERVEQLYFALTGQRPPHVEGTPMPPETDPARHVEEQLGRLLAATERLAPTAAASAWTPRACAWHDDVGAHLAIDVPGVGRDSIELELDGRRLVVRGTRTPPWQDQTPRGLDGGEAQYGAFSRAFVFAARVEPEQLAARLDSGVLHVRVLRAQLGEPSRIPILVS
ncbi:MAG TPA: Hsp20/alpha crystallin family protein [Kofleriaceae bacterium]|nr:Hsp20/alpha crystallin family protein [Kofleriaceae bacterium]